jgi:Leucine-rich repeat (LRR) protein
MSNEQEVMKPTPWQQWIRSILVAILLLGASSARADIPPAERAVLLEIFAMTNGASWYNKTGWDTATAGTECTWYGVTCNASPSVTKLQLAGNNLVGSLPSDFNNLTNLTDVVIGGNHFNSPIPSLTGLTSLKSFFADSSELTGPIPSLAGLISLVNFIVHDNKLTGSIPLLAGLTNLGDFEVYNNKLTGPIPPLTGLINLTCFYVFSNKLTGSIPPLTGLTNLEDFEVYNNKLTGPIPPDLTSIPKLRYFFTDHNQLTGDPPVLPNPSHVLKGSLCPNFLNHVPDPLWDAISGTTPWFKDCPAAPTVQKAPALSPTFVASLAVLLVGIGVWALRRARVAA